MKEPKEPMASYTNPYEHTLKYLYKIQGEAQKQIAVMRARAVEELQLLMQQLHIGDVVKYTELNGNGDTGTVTAYMHDNATISGVVITCTYGDVRIRCENAGMFLSVEKVEGD